MRMRTIGKVLVLAIALIGIAALSVAQTAPKPKFDVGSVKPATPDTPIVAACRGRDFPINPALPTPPPLGTCDLNGVTLRQIVRIAYRPELLDGMSDADLVSGAPQWATSDRFEIEGKAASPDTTTTKELYGMLQTFLADRFKLQLYRDHKDVQGYALVVAKNGPKLKPDTSGDEHGSLLPTGRTPGEWEGKNIALSLLASSLSGLFEAPVVDKTGLAGRYNFTLRYAPRSALNTVAQPLPRPLQDLPSIFEALPDQLGLRLQQEKEPVIVLAIDSVQRPTEN